MALVAIWALATESPLPGIIGWLILALTFIAASFMAWKRERQKAEAATISPHEQESRRFVSRELAGASHEEFAILMCILDRGEILASQLDLAIKNPEAVSRSIEKWLHKLIAERVEPDTQRTFYSIIPGRRAALEFELFKTDDAPR